MNNSTNFVLRLYQTTDKPWLFEIFECHIPQYFAPDEIHDFEQYLEQYGDTYWIIESQNKVVGGIGYQADHKPHIGQITWMFLHPDHLGLGLGRKSLTHCLAILSANPNLEKIIVTTSQLAYEFFEKFGFELKNIEEEYWGPGLDLYEMELWLR